MMRVLLVEDHTLVREGLRLLLEEMGNIAVVGQATDGLQALSLAEQLQPDLVILDVSLPNLNGLEAASRLRSMARPPEIIMLSQHNRIEYVVQALRAGARAYVLKDAVVDELARAFAAIRAGERYLSHQLPIDLIEERLQQPSEIGSPIELLTSREREVLQLVVEGNTNRAIAHELSISIKTVEKHRFNVMEKLGVRDVTGLVRMAIQEGLLPDQSGA